MKKTIAALWRLDQNEAWVLPAASAGFWLAAEVIAGFIAWSGGLASVWPVGAAASLYGGAVLALFLNSTRFAVEFDFLLRFPISRRCALAAELCLQLGHGLLGLAAAFALTLLTGPFHRALYGVQDVSPWMLCPWWAWGLALVLPVLLGLFDGSVIQRFGRRGGIVLYLLFMGPCITCGSWIEGLIDRLAAAPALLYALPPLAAAAVLLLAALGACWLLRTPVQAK